MAKTEVKKKEPGTAEFGPVRSAMAAFNRGLGRVVSAFEVVSLSAGIAALTILLIVEVIARSFFQSLYYADEISEFLVIFVTFTGVSYGVRKARHIRMGAFFDAMGPRLEKIFILAISAISSVTMFLMAWYSWIYMKDAMRVAQYTPALRIPSWTMVVIVPVGFFLAGVQYIRTIIRNIVRIDEVWMSPEQKSEYEEEDYGGY